VRNLKNTHMTVSQIVHWMSFNTLRTLARTYVILSELIINNEILMYFDTHTQ